MMPEPRRRSLTPAAKWRCLLLALLVSGLPCASLAQHDEEETREKLEELEADNAPHKWTREGLIEVRDTYRAKLKDIQKGET